jgi:hypothetical protein
VRRIRPRGVWKVLLIGVAMLIGLGVALSAWWMADISPVLLEKGIAAATGASVQIESVSFTLREGLALRARHFRAAWPDRSVSIDAHALVLSVELFPLLHRQLVVRQVALERGEIELGKDALSGRRAGALPLDLRGVELELKDVTLRYGRFLPAKGGEHALRLHDVTLEFSRQEGTDVFALLSFSAENLRAEATGPLPRWMPQVTGKGRLGIQKGEVIFEETVLDLGDAQVTGKGRVRVTEKGMTIGESHWTTHGAPFSLTGRVSWSRAGLAYTFHLSAPTIAIATLRAIPGLRPLWSEESPLATASGSVGLQLTLHPEKTAGTVTLHGVTLSPENHFPPVTLTGPVDIDGGKIALRSMQGRIKEIPFEMEGTVEGVGSLAWSLEAEFRSMLPFPQALNLLPSDPSGQRALVGNIPLRGKVSVTADHGSVEASAPLQDLERLELFQFRKLAASSGWVKIKTSWEASHDVSSDIELALSAGEFFALPVRDVSVQALLQGGTLDVPRLRFQLDQGVVEGRARLASSTVDLELQVRDAQANAVLSHLFGLSDRLYGTLSLDAQLSGPWSSREKFLQGAKGSVDVVVEKGRIENVDLPGRLLHLATLAHEGILDFNLSRAFQTLSPEPLDHFELLSGRFEVAHGQARPENLVFVAHNLGLQGQGTIDLTSSAIDFVIEGQVPKGSGDHAGLLDRAVARVRLGEALDLVRRVPGLDRLLGKVEEEHVFRLRLMGDLLGEKKVTDFSWVH